MKILIVDDNPADIALAKARLAKEQLEILAADGGKAALDMVRREKPELVLLDLDMPGMSGFEVCRAIKSEPNTCMIPVIFLSSAGSPKEKARGLDLGAVDYVTKPFDAFELRARVRAALRTKHLQDLLIEYAHVDPLTGLPNRRALMDYMRQEWAKIVRHGGSLAVIMVDIDNFKFVNDTFGHSIGDEVLQKAAKAIAGECRECDHPFRYGGDEFSIIVPHETASNAMNLAERCRKTVQGLRHEAAGRTIPVTASFGVADSTQAPSPDSCVERADKALYEAKQSGRNAVRGFATDSECAA